MLLNKLSKEVFVTSDLPIFYCINVDVINKHFPHKRKHAWGNQMPFIIKGLSEAIMNGSRLSNGFIKNRINENKILNTKQRNYCISFLRKSKNKRMGK